MQYYIDNVTSAQFTFPNEHRIIEVSLYLYAVCFYQITYLRFELSLVGWVEWIFAITSGVQYESHDLGCKLSICRRACLLFLFSTKTGASNEIAVFQIIAW